MIRRKGTVERGGALFACYEGKEWNNKGEMFFCGEKLGREYSQ
jgi:hypothetical protein